MKKLYKEKIKHSLSFLLLFISSSSSFAQDNMVNSGTLYIGNAFSVSMEGDFTTDSNGTTEIAGDLYLKGNWTNDGIFITNTGKVTYWGNAAQSINGMSGTVFYDTEINKAANGVTLNSNTEVSNELHLINGSFDLNSKLLTVSNSSTAAIDYANGYIISEDVDNSSLVQWNIDSTMGAHVIPFGTTGGVLIPLTVELTSGKLGNLIASTYSTAPDNLPLPTFPTNVTDIINTSGTENSANMVDRFWQIDNSGESGIITTTLTYADAEAPLNGEIGLISQRYDGSTSLWDPAVPLQSSDASANTVTASGVTSFGPYSISSSSHQLPVEMLLFKADADIDNHQVNLNWATASEENSDFFTIERSKDNHSFESIGTTDAAGNSSISRFYSSTDKNPYPGTSYYRLKQTDFNGKFSYSETKSVHFDKYQHATLSIFPSPAISSAYFYVDNIDEWSAVIKADIYDARGKIIASKELTKDEKSAEALFKVDRNGLAPGIYFIKAANVNGMVCSGKLVFQ